jgi:hypothetical protein
MCCREKEVCGCTYLIKSRWINPLLSYSLFPYSTCNLCKIFCAYSLCSFFLPSLAHISFIQRINLQEVSSLTVSVFILGCRSYPSSSQDNIIIYCLWFGAYRFCIIPKYHGYCRLKVFWLRCSLAPNISVLLNSFLSFNVRSNSQYVHVGMHIIPLFVAWYRNSVHSKAYKRFVHLKSI